MKQTDHVDTYIHAETSWWMWICWVDDHADGGFVYGCAAQSSRPPGWHEDRTVEIADAVKLLVSQRTVSDDDFRRFRQAAEEGAIKPHLLGCTMTREHRTAHVRRIVQDGLGQTAARVVACYTLPNPETLFGNSDSNLATVLSFLESELNLRFKSSYAARFGNFEFFELNPWLDETQPFLVEVARA
jgi:hypothetical protein